MSGEELTQFATLYGVSVDGSRARPGNPTPAEDRILLAARELSKMKDQDLDSLMSLLHMLRKSKEQK